MPLASPNTDHHPPAINVGHYQSDGFGDPQTRGIATGHNGTLVSLAHTVQKFDYLLSAKDDRKCKERSIQCYGFVVTNTGAIVVGVAVWARMAE